METPNPMPDYCTCGAQLPNDALFCHKCGKPQRDLVAEEQPGEATSQFLAALDAAPPPERRALPVSFRNPIALRIALLAGVGAMVFNFLPFVNFLAAGFFAVFFYRRQTHDRMDVHAGVQMGWITGLVTFAAQSVFYIVLGATGLLTPLLKEQARGWSVASDPNFQQMVQFVATPSGLVAFLAVFLIFIFVFSTCLTMAGGALGAKLIGRD